MQDSDGDNTNRNGSQEQDDNRITATGKQQQENSIRKTAITQVSSRLIDQWVSGASATYISNINHINILQPTPNGVSPLNSIIFREYLLFFNIL